MASPSRASAQSIQPTDGSSVIKAWVDALDGHNVDGALALLSDQPFLILDSSLGNGILTYSGKNEINGLLQSYVSDNIQARLERDPQEENGTTFWTESRTSDRLAKLGVNMVEYKGEALVQSGKITSLIYTPTPESEAAIARALGTQPTGMPTTGAALTKETEWTTWIAISLWSVVAGLGLHVLNGREKRRKKRQSA